MEEKIIDFELPIFSHRIVFSINGNGSKLAHILKNKGLATDWVYETKPGNANTGIRYDIPLTVVRIPSFINTSAKDIGLLSHECIHVAFDVVRSIGDSPGETTEETICYIQDYLITKLLNEI